LLGYIITPL